MAWNCNCNQRPFGALNIIYSYMTILIGISACTNSYYYGRGNNYVYCSFLTFFACVAAGVFGIVITCFEKRELAKIVRSLKKCKSIILLFNCQYFQHCGLIILACIVTTCVPITYFLPDIRYRSGFDKEKLVWIIEGLIQGFMVGAGLWPESKWGGKIRCFC